MATAPRIRVLGSRHSFSDIADSAELLSLERLPPAVVVDRDAMTVACAGAVRYGELAVELDREGLALANLASLPHIAVAGAVSTATHGSGDGNGNLATAVAALEIVTSDGSIVTAARGDPDFAGLVVGLGATGAVTRITLDVEPAYQVRQRVFEGLRWVDLFDHFDAISSSGYSVSVFTRWGDVVDQVWVKERVAEGSDASTRPDSGTGDEGLFTAVAATENRHPILGIDPVNCTPQLGVAGSPAERLPHFRMGFTPSSGAELQSEYLVPRRSRHGPDRGRPTPLRDDPTTHSGERDPHGRGRRAVDEPSVRAGHDRDPLHLESPARGGGARARGGRAGAGPVRGPSPLGQAVPGRGTRDRPFVREARTTSARCSTGSTRAAHSATTG